MWRKHVAAKEVADPLQRSKRVVEYSVESRAMLAAKKKIVPGATDQRFGLEIHADEHHAAGEKKTMLASKGVLLLDQ